MTEQKRKTGQFKVIGGSVVIAPPDDEAQPEEASAETVLETTKGAITIKVDGDKDVSQVTDAESEALSNQNAAQLRDENQKAAEEAKVDTKPRKAGNSVVTSGTFNDIDLPEYDESQKKDTAKAEEKAEEAQAEKAKEDEKKSSAEEAFHAALQDAFDQQSEEFVEVHEEDE